MENEILKELLQEKILLGDFDNPVKVSINQFYGVEINDFACTVAQTALWIAELQMRAETAEIIHKNLDFLPLKSYANIFEGNALRMDWKNILPEDLNFIMGNPPFVGYTFQTNEQKKDIAEIFKSRAIDYVSCWYFKTSEFIQQKNIRCAFVSTNSITQGEQVANVWKPIYEKFKIHIDFAFRTFKWNSESTEKAAVHCVIIGFSFADNLKQKIIFDGEEKIFAQNINAYLNDAPNIFILSRNKPLCDVPKMITGNRPADGGNLILSEDEKNILIKNFPSAERFIKVLIGGEEFLHNKKRYCLWLVDANPSDIKKIPPIFERVKKCREDRLKGAADRQKLAEVPHLFRETLNPKNFIVVPKTSSENRKYIPIDFLNENFIVTDSLLTIPDATIYNFGVLISSVHMAWMRAVCGRLESRYRYSKDIVYNNFIWCNPTTEQREKIEKTAKKILEVISKFPNSTLADLYGKILLLWNFNKFGSHGLDADCLRTFKI